LNKKQMGPMLPHGEP